MAVGRKHGFAQVALDYSGALKRKEISPVRRQRKAIGDYLQRDTNAEDGKPAVRIRRKQESLDSP